MYVYVRKRMKYNRKFEPTPDMARGTLWERTFPKVAQPERA